jgi:putative tricarboxylic transport membrane protein
MMAGGEQLFSRPGIWLGFLIVLPIAVISGLKPGGGVPVFVILLGLTSHLDPWVVVCVAIFYKAASDLMEPVPSILLGIPGGRSAQATVLDGYPMAQKGLAGVAIGASYTCNLIGGVFGALVLLALLPFARQLILIFGSAEFFLLTIIGVMTVAVVSSGAFIKGLLTGGLGIAIAMVGYSAIGGDIRATFGLNYLYDGVPLGPLVVGLFAIPEAVALVVGGKPVAGKRVDLLMKEADRDVLRGIVEGFRHFRLMIQSSAIGTAIGMMPGLGAPVAHWISYAVARNTEKGAHQTFGKGDVRGVIASDAPNSSADGGELFPTLAFGIPGTAGMSIMIAIFVLCGFTPGYSMMTNHLDVVVALVYVLIIANTLTVPIVMVFAPYLARLTLANPAVLAPIVIWVAMLAAYMTTNSVADLAVVLIFAMLGLFMKAYGWPRPPILIAVALGEIMEKYLWIAVNNYGFSMFARPQFLSILAVMGLVALVGVRMRRQVASTVKEVRQEAVAMGSPGAAVIAAALPDPETEAAPIAVAKVPLRDRITLEFAGEIVLLALVAAFLGYMLWDSTHWRFSDRLTPLIGIAIAALFWVLRVGTIILSFFRPIQISSRESQIMDTGFEQGMNTPEARLRFFQIFGFTLALALVVWVFGFHFGATILLGAYLIAIAGLSWFWTGVILLGALAILVGFYDQLLGIPWHVPLIVELLK